MSKRNVANRCFRTLRAMGLAATALLLHACANAPEGVEPVRDFELSRYLGTWYEIARLDHRFERGLSSVTASYSMREDGGVRVINRGFDSASNTWQEAEGKAFFIGEPDVGQLKVSFFGPFYGAYNVMALDGDYQWAMVAGPSTSYLWILARGRQLDPGILQDLKNQARAAGFPVAELILVEHEPADS